MRSPALKAGLIGAGSALLVTLLLLVPIPSALTGILWLVVVGITGGLAAHFVVPPRDMGRCSGQGALAGLIAGGCGGFLFTALFAVQLQLMGGAQVIAASLPDESLAQFEQLGVDPTTFLGASGIAAMLLCCLPVGLALGAALGALGAAIFCAARSD